MSGHAEMLANDQLLNDILDGLERDAMEMGVNANPSDDETRRISAMEVRAIRSLRGKLASLAKGAANPDVANPVA